MTKTNDELQAEVNRLEAENKLLRRTLTIQQEQMKHGGMSDEHRRLRAKLAEWEGSMPLMNGGYYHGSRFIKPYDDNPGV